MKFTQVYMGLAGKGKDPPKSKTENVVKSDDTSKTVSKSKKEDECKEYCDARNSQGTIDARRAQVTGAASNAFKRAQTMVSNAPHIQQFAIGTAAGWTTGFLSTKIGKTAALIGGGSVILIVGANQAGLIHINWDKFGKKFEQTGTKLESKVPAMKGHLGKYARTNTYFVAGFVGGFLLGIVS